MKIAPPAGDGFDPARLARLEAFVRERYVDSGKLPNAQLLVAHDGAIVHFSSAGAAREGGAPIDEGSLRCSAAISCKRACRTGYRFRSPGAV